jgi:23S rRNA (cytidine1920-2'-O)/16S rRNA (cytidine1409-2'-O)-methyltransferase
MAASKLRLDQLMVNRGLAESRDWAQRLIRAGEVRVNGQVIDQPAKLVLDAPDLLIGVDQPPKYVSRGGLKLEGALDAFQIDPRGRICADVGSSTGGFSDCLLQRGAAKIYALDVGTNQLHWKLRNDPRLVIQEKVNVRFVDTLKEKIALAVVDVSFISLALILPKVFGWFEAGGGLGVIALIKPQFEAGREHVGRGGIVRDPAVHEAVVQRVSAFSASQGWPVAQLIESPIFGTDGNKEFLAWLRPE